MFCWQYFIGCLHSISAPVAGYIIELSTYCYLLEADLTSNLYCPSVPPSPENRCVSFISVKISQTYISSCGTILASFSWALYLVVQSYGMMGSGVLCAPTLGYCAIILCITLGGTRVSTLGVSGYRALRDSDICSALGGAPGFYRQA